MCIMFTLKQYRNKLCKMSHFLLTDMEKEYPEQVVNMPIMGLAAVVTKPEGGKRG